MRVPRPVYETLLFQGRVTIAVYGAPFNWNFAGASRDEMEVKNPGITSAIEAIMRRHKITCALVPKPTFNAEVAVREELHDEILPGFFRGKDADGAILSQSGVAYMLASADCLTTLIYNPLISSVAALHCGRNALLDRSFIDHGQESKRKHASVVDAAITCMDSLYNWVLDSGDQIDHVDHSLFAAFCAAGIRPESFEHPTVDHKFADANKRMISWLQEQYPDSVKDEVCGKLDLFALVRRQLAHHGISSVQEDQFDTATSIGKNGCLLFHSYRRNPLHRNLVIVKLN